MALQRDTTKEPVIADIITGIISVADEVLGFFRHNIVHYELMGNLVNVMYI